MEGGLHGGPGYHGPGRLAVEGFRQVLVTSAVGHQCLREEGGADDFGEACAAEAAHDLKAFLELAKHAATGG
ncbi:hypothetical protein ACGF0D_35425 [Kitasatospora sp. NPDC048298]|uniref:hypothetical protein n=1 Tax=Kitasatospora sp. NPDC048298 TaxID=3364049 RepID=UPI0037102A39